MRRNRTAYLDIIVQVCQLAGTTVIVAASLAMAAWTLAAAAGLAPWLTLSVTLSGTVYPQAGIAVQVGLTLFLLALLAYLPGVFRVLRLEHSHRDFSICMSDVMDAYAACHRADRQGVFTLSQEFDAVKERIAYLRKHPDLGDLEPAVLEAAAEMSFASRDLAETYSDENVERARTFLRQRQEEIETFNERIELAKARMHELRRWTEQVEIEESVMESQLRRLREEFGDLIERYDFTRPAEPDNLYRMKIAAE